MLPEKADLYPVEINEKLNQLTQGNNKQEKTVEDGELDDKGDDFVVDRTEDTKIAENNKVTSFPSLTEFPNIPTNMDEKQQDTGGIRS